MCRQIQIDCGWDDEHADEDAGELFEAGSGYDKLIEGAQDKLQRLIEDHFVGSVDIRVVPMPTPEADTELLKLILEQDIGTIANIIQFANESSGPLFDRLTSGVHAMIGTDADPNRTISLDDIE